MSLPPVDILLVTGPLGAGKTTVVNRLLRAEVEAGRRVSVLINEFGAVSVDGALVAAERPEIAGLENLVNGCACCSLRPDVVEVLDRWAGLPEGERPHRIVLETTGLADPTDLLDLEGEPQLAGRIRLVGCLTVVSAVSPLHHLQQRPLVHRQVALASLVFVSKADLDPSMAVAWESQVRAAGCPAVARTRRGVAPEGSPDPWAGELRPVPEGWTSGAGPSYAAARALTVTWDRPVDPEALERLFLQPLPGGELLRAKGVAAFQGWPLRPDGSDRWAFQVADGRVEIMPVGLLPDGQPAPAMGVVIGTGLDLAAWKHALQALQQVPGGLEDAWSQGLLGAP